MTKNERLVTLIDLMFQSQWRDDDLEIIEYWKTKIRPKLLEVKPITKNGQAILETMKSSDKEEMTATEIADLMFATARSVSSSMRKLVDDGLVIKRLDQVQAYPVMKYSLVNKGITKKDLKLIKQD